MAKDGDFVSFFQPHGQSSSLKRCPGAAILRGKFSGLRGGGMVTSQSDSCINESDPPRRCNSDEQLMLSLYTLLHYNDILILKQLLAGPVHDISSALTIIMSAVMPVCSG